MDKIEEKIINIIEENKEEIKAFARDIEAHPEPGFCERRTAAQVAKAFRGLGLHTKEQLAVTGVRGSLSKKEGAELTILGEMDAIGCRNHQKADKENGTAHACGHHAQLAAMLGAAMALSDEEVRASLHGNVSFLAVPAEEYIDIKKERRFRKRELVFRLQERASLFVQESLTAQILCLRHTYIWFL